MWEFKPKRGSKSAEEDREPRRIDLLVEMKVIYDFVGFKVPKRPGL